MRCGLGDGVIGEVFSMQARGPESGPQNSQKQTMWGEAHLQGGREKCISGACWPVLIA